MTEEKSIVARFIIEILGAPKEYITKALKEHMEKLKQEGLDIQYENYAEPQPKDKLFMQFVETQISFKDMQELLDFCFDSMPSSVEIISPEEIRLQATELEDFLNDFQAKLHHADFAIKTVSAQKQVLDRNTVNIFHNFIKYACSTKQYTIEDLSKLLGLSEEELTPFVEHLVKKEIIKKEGIMYSTK